MSKKPHELNQDDFSFLSDDGLGGYSQLTADVMSFPFLRVVQDMSPQLKESKPEYIEGIRVGMVFNTITNHFWDTYRDAPLRLIIGKFERYFIEWKPNRGGFVAAHDPTTVEQALREHKLMVGERGGLFDPTTGNKFSDTFVYYVLLPDYMEEGVCLLSLSSTQLKAAKKLNRNLVSTVLPGSRNRALPHHMVFKLTTPIVKNDKGEWHDVRIEFDSFVTKEMYLNVTEARKELPESRPDFKALEAAQSENEALEGEVYDVEATGKF